MLIKGKSCGPNLISLMFIDDIVKLTVDRVQHRDDLLKFLNLEISFKILTMGVEEEQIEVNPTISLNLGEIFLG